MVLALSFLLQGCLSSTVVEKRSPEYFFKTPDAIWLAEDGSIHFVAKGVSTHSSGKDIRFYSVRISKECLAEELAGRTGTQELDWSEMPCAVVASARSEFVHPHETCREFKPEELVPVEIDGQRMAIRFDHYAARRGENGAPAWLALLPITIPLDIILLPPTIALGVIIWAPVYAYAYLAHEPEVVRDVYDWLDQHARFSTTTGM